jgi:hypothetical protein
LEVVCHGYHTRCIREKGTYDGKTAFIGFIDDALRRYNKEANTTRLTVDRIHEIIADLQEKLRILGRKLSWDKAYVSETLSTILGEIFYYGMPMRNGSKAFVSFADVELKAVEDASSMEGNYASKAIGAKVAGCNEIAAYYAYVHNTLRSHHRLGVRVNEYLNLTEYALWCMAPIALGGAGMRSPIELDSSESGDRFTAGIGNLSRLTYAEPTLTEPVNRLTDGELEVLSPLDFLRNPTQLHVVGPRIRTQRLTQYVRSNLSSYATSPAFAPVFAEEQVSMRRLEDYAKEMQNFGEVDVEEVTRYYEGTAVAKLDSLVSKICTSDTVKNLVPLKEIKRIRQLVRNDAVLCSQTFRYRLSGIDIPESLGGPVRIVIPAV